MKHFLAQDNKQYIAIYSNKVQIFKKQNLELLHELAMSLRIEAFICSSEESLLFAVEKDAPNLCLFD